MPLDTIFQISIVLIAISSLIIIYGIFRCFKRKITIEYQKNIWFWVKIAVNGGEQIFNKEGKGKQKKEYVISFLESLDFNLSRGQLDVLIEAAVMEMNRFKEEYKID